LFRYGDDLKRLQWELQATKTKAQVADYYFHHIYPPTQLDSHEILNAPLPSLVSANSSSSATRRRIRDMSSGGGNGMVEEKELEVEDDEDDEEVEEGYGWDKDEAQLDEAFDQWDHQTTAAAAASSGQSHNGLAVSTATTTISMVEETEQHTNNDIKTEKIQQKASDFMNR
jgi:hypothetical protein